ncbi:hypothetical protein THOM_2841 [Trachipleistophora hominis]|uniref:Uncharacterized protein n=1 Tax=Trachipleistophora hominis TaxID=72359 RepID=L7JS43_TRAHO|nr:hypothetical protein THOM_2841 [Trachipleistophora hominis]
MFYIVVFLYLNTYMCTNISLYELPTLTCIQKGMVAGVKRSLDQSMVLLSTMADIETSDTCSTFKLSYSEITMYNLQLFRDICDLTLAHPNMTHFLEQAVHILKKFNASFIGCMFVKKRMQNIHPVPIDMHLIQSAEECVIQVEELLKKFIPALEVGISITMVPSVYLFDNLITFIKETCKLQDDLINQTYYEDFPRFIVLLTTLCEEYLNKVSILQLFLNAVRDFQQLCEMN